MSGASLPNVAYAIDASTLVVTRPDDELASKFPSCFAVRAGDNCLGGIKIGLNEVSRRTHHEAAIVSDLPQDSLALTIPAPPQSPAHDAPPVTLIQSLGWQVVQTPSG